MWFKVNYIIDQGEWLPVLIALLLYQLIDRLWKIDYLIDFEPIIRKRNQLYNDDIIYIDRLMTNRALVDQLINYLDWVFFGRADLDRADTTLFSETAALQ